MNDIQNISHVYRGLILRNRAFASFKKDELDIIYSDMKETVPKDITVLDPMSGYGGGMTFLGKEGYKTINIEINPPSYFWQLLINPRNTEEILALIQRLEEKRKYLPKIKEIFSITDDLFTENAAILIKDLYEFISRYSNNKELSIALLLPFVSRFANYQISSTNITHFKEGGMQTYVGWENDFMAYLFVIKNKLQEAYILYKEIDHQNICGDMMKVKLAEKYSCFVTSPPYPNYRDYSKLFKIENWVLNNIINDVVTDFRMMIGSNNVSGKQYGNIQSKCANHFLMKLLDKSRILKKKSRRDIEIYYYPYFAQYFFNMQEAYVRLNDMITNNAIGYIVVNDNITRDIIVPVGASICDIFENLNYNVQYYNISQISHYGNIGKTAKRINSHHTRYILKVWK